MSVDKENIIDRRSEVASSAIPQEADDSFPSSLGTLPLSPVWKQLMRQASVEAAAAPKPARVVPKNPDVFTGQLNFVDDERTAADMVDLIKQRPIAFAGIDTEFNYGRPGVLMKPSRDGGYYWNDPRSVAPLLMSLTLVESTSPDCESFYRFVIDLRSLCVLPALREMLSLPIPFVGHYLTAELMCIWQLDLPTPRLVWDTWVAEKTFCLGRFHRRYAVAQSNDSEGEIQASGAAGDLATASLSLASTCLRRGVHHPFAAGKVRLQESFLNHSPGKPFSAEQLEYAAADATAAAELYSRQIRVAGQSGCLAHLETIEMPWAVTNASMNWHGVRVDQNRLQKLSAACKRHVLPLEAELAAWGLGNVDSHPQLQVFMTQLGLLESFRKGRGFSFDDKHLEAAQNQHSAIAKIRTVRKIRRLQTDKLFTGELVGADGRLHPEHRQLGAESGRNSMRWPNIGGIGQALRPVVVPDEGNQIGEVDLSQIEVGIAAAVYEDPELIRMFNGQDVYVAMATRYYAEELGSAASSLSDSQFKKKYRQYRNKMKVYTLGIIYGISDYGLAIQLDVQVSEAAKQKERFLAMFPVLVTALQEASAYGAIRGYAQLCSGLRRHRVNNGRPSKWEANWLRNTPVQGAAGIVFKAAGNRLYQRYQHYGAKLILPLHDAFIFECPEHHLSKVAKLTAEVMCSTVQEYFPVLEPRADINIDSPTCWNKDGHDRSLRLWMAHPDLAAS